MNSVLLHRKFISGFCIINLGKIQLFIVYIGLMIVAFDYPSR
jgi:hypothetical protein